MTGQEFLHTMISQGGMMIQRFTKIVDEEEFFRFHRMGPSIAWTVIHLTGQHEWVVSVTTGKETIHSVDLLEKFRGGGSIAGECANRYREIMPERDEIIDMYNRSFERSLELLSQLSEDDLNSNPKVPDVAEMFGTLGNVWSQLVWHTHWHIGQLATLEPKLAPSEVSQPMRFKGTLRQ